MTNTLLLLHINHNTRIHICRNYINTHNYNRIDTAADFSLFNSLMFFCLLIYISYGGWGAMFDRKTWFNFIILHSNMLTWNISLEFSIISIALYTDLSDIHKLISLMLWHIMYMLILLEKCNFSH